MVVSSVLMFITRGSDCVLCRFFLELVAAGSGAEVIGLAPVYAGGGGFVAINRHPAYRVIRLAFGHIVGFAMPAVMASAAHDVRTATVAHHEKKQSAPEQKRK